MLLWALSAGRGQRKPFAGKRVAVHVADVVGDPPIVGVGVLKLQDGLLHLPGSTTDLDRPAVVDGRVRFRERPCVGGDFALRRAGGRVLATDIKIHGEVAVIADIGLAECCSIAVSRYQCCLGRIDGDLRHVCGGSWIDNPIPSSSRLRGWDC